MNERFVTLQDIEHWNDDVGQSFAKAAIRSVNTFNEYSASVWSRIDQIAAYSKDDVQYESQKNTLLQMRVEYHG